MYTLVPSRHGLTSPAHPQAHIGILQNWQQARVGNISKVVRDFLIFKIMLPDTLMAHMVQNVKMRNLPKFRGNRSKHD